MGKTPYALIQSVAVIVGLWGTPSILVGAERAEAFPLVVIVQDMARVFPGTLDQAVKEAARIYRQAGVTTEWLTDPASANGSAANEGLARARSANQHDVLRGLAKRHRGQRVDQLAIHR